MSSAVCICLGRERSAVSSRLYSFPSTVPRDLAAYRANRYSTVSWVV